MLQLQCHKATPQAQTQFPRAVSKVSEGQIEGIGSDSALCLACSKVFGGVAHWVPGALGKDLSSICVLVKEVKDDQFSSSME